MSEERERNQACVLKASLPWKPWGQVHVSSEGLVKNETSLPLSLSFLCSIPQSFMTGGREGGWAGDTTSCVCGMRPTGLRLGPHRAAGTASPPALAIHQQNSFLAVAAPRSVASKPA